MSITRTAVVKAADSLKGITESPAGSNRTSTGEWYGMNGYPWCAMQVSRIFAKAGAPHIRFASCDVGEEQFRNGAWGKLVGKGERWLPGDIVFYGVGADSQHVGIVLEDDGTWITTHEGNTSPQGSSGSQSNGGGSYQRKRRKADPWVLHAGRPDCFAKPTPPQPEYHLTAVKVREFDVTGKEKAEAKAEELRKQGYLVKKERRAKN
jgi:hypothetical protein